MNNNCPKCGKKISPFYMKQYCPHCNVDLLYYKLEERLEADAKESERQEKNLKKFVETVKSSSISSPVLIFRLVLFFTPLASMCLPMYSDVSLISLIMGIINGELDIGANIMPVISMALVVVLSLVVIISSLFSVTKNGLKRNLILSIINTVVFVVLGLIIGSLGAGWYITLGIYIVEIILHFVCNRIIKNKLINQKIQENL